MIAQQISINTKIKMSYLRCVTTVVLSFTNLIKNVLNITCLTF